MEPCDGGQDRVGPVGLPIEVLTEVVTVGAGFLFAWIRSFEDYIRALFLTGPNTDVLTIWMFSRIRQLDAPGSNAVPSLIVFAIAIALAVAMNYGNVTGYVADRN